MDHLTHLSNALKRPLYLPRVYQKRVDYDEFGLAGFPERCLGSVIHINSYDDMAEHADFLQAWLFFGLIHQFGSIFEVAIDLDDFVRKNEDSVETVTTENLPIYIWMCAAAVSTESFLNDGIVSINTARTRMKTASVHALLRAVHQIVDGLWDVDAQASSPGHPVVVPITILFEALYMATHGLLLPSTGLTYQSPLAPKYLRRFAAECGWCPGQVTFFSRALNSASSFYLLATRMKRPEGKDHSTCIEERCNAFQLDEASYRTKHVKEDCTCDHSLDTDVATRVASILDDNKLPVITVETARNEGAEAAIRLKVYDSATVPRYVAISHVWSDGMGNTTENTLPQCLLRSLQAKVGRLYPEETQPVAFWIDTICVPRERRLRNKAIRRLVPTYRDAHRVLVMDQSLQKLSTTNSSAEERLFYSRICPWTTRLWTFQEARLAKDLYYDFSDAAYTTSKILYDSFTSSSGPMKLDVRAVMDAPKKSMAEMTETERQRFLLRVRLFRAMLIVHVIDKEWFGLDEREVGAYHRWLKEFLSEEHYSLDTTTADKHLAEWLRCAFQLDPVLLWDSTSTISYTRGAYLHDGPEPNQLGLVLAALLGRTTSWREDEAICVANMMGIDSSPIILQSDASERMRTLLLTLGEVPNNLIFYRCPRLGFQGFRWAPKSFLHLQPTGLVHNQPALAKVKDAGLYIAGLPGIHFHLKDGSLPHDHQIIIRIGEKKYTLTLFDDEPKTNAFWDAFRDREVMAIVEDSRPDQTPRRSALVQLDICDGDTYKVAYERFLVVDEPGREHAESQDTMGWGQWLDNTQKWLVS